MTVIKRVCIGDIGLHFFGENGRELVLSHEQIDILRLIDTHSTMTHYDLCNHLYGSRQERAALSASKRAALSRSLRRLADAQFIERINTGVKITAEGSRLIAWLINDWEYDQHYQHGVKWGMLPPKKTLTDRQQSPSG